MQNKTERMLGIVVVKNFVKIRYEMLEEEQLYTFNATYIT